MRFKFEKATFVIAIVLWLIGISVLLFGEPQPAIDTNTGVVMYYTNPMLYGVTHLVAGIIVLLISNFIYKPKEKKT